MRQPLAPHQTKCYYELLTLYGFGVVRVAIVRGSNPVWLFDDLTGNLLDDTFYLFVLQNTIPYNPSTVYQNAAGTVPWTNPIQFLANGTLPNNIFFLSDLTYRLEVRAGDTQSDALIYLVEDYQPGSTGGSSTAAAPSADNQMTNTQFSLVSFDPDGSLSITSSGTYQVAPGWELVLAGSGTATITREALTSAETNPTNAPYALRLNLVGWNNTGTYLRQRFNQAGMLWSSSASLLYVTSSVTAKLGSGANASISARLIDSNGTDLAVVLSSSTVTQTYTQFSDVSDFMPQPSNTDTPPAAWVEYRLILPGSIDIAVTSFQAIPTAVQTKFDYEQDTIERQVDHTYHLATPIVPVGTVIDYFGFDDPDHYLTCDYTAYSRQTYYELFSKITKLETVTLTSASATFTVVSSALYRIGMGLEADGIPDNTTITNISGTTITMSSDATATASTPVRFFAAARTFSETVSLTNASPTFTVASAANYAIGMRLTGTSIPASTVISNIVSTTITMNNNATSTVSSSVTFYSAGAGDNDTTFNVYDLRDYVVAGVGGSLFGTASNGLGAQGGAASHQITTNELPAHTHQVQSGAATGTGAASRVVANAAGTGGFTGVNVTTHTAMSLVQQTALARKLIRFE